ncbi:glucosylglycerol-phosphate synthase [Parapedobacter indicus]|uniref:Glucosyl-glycerol phosphate synthase n=1 Tax=Parapedobacter indicus TaxID=1477437 RepID=A0A1I3DP12_9SPHI|nr:glucosylglycerol-phosphate synthase [Parapedobacter indicus]PPL04777.1 glucosyl-glycerol phosphate synthase [Parapedobacter indicus]SFH88480.1 glucosyl-glycerol phosphate synthase [Parapedobacter indicus]
MLLATDLDGTFLGGTTEKRQTLYQLIRNHPDIDLVFVTGRGIETVLPLLHDPLVPTPDYIIADVGATVVDGSTLMPVASIQSGIERQWPGQFVIRKQLAAVRGLSLQEVPQQRRCSFYYDEKTDIAEVEQLASALRCDVLTSAGKYLDILPKAVNKGTTLSKLITHLGIPEDEVLVAGDTYNDYALFETGYRGVAVGDSEPRLLDAVQQWPHVYAATEPGAGGILEAMAHFETFRHYHSDHTEPTIHSADSKQLLMVYHRLPFDIEMEDGHPKRIPPRSPNGIIPSLLGFFSNGRPGIWIGEEALGLLGDHPVLNPPIDSERYPNLRASIIPLPKKDIDLFYRVFSKEAFWPTIFSFINKAKFDHTHWAHYLRINELFANRVADEAEPNALVWIHEYNLWMVPAFLRQRRPDLKIGFFHHTAFPPADIFNIIPWRRDIIGSLLQCDFISFHIPRYVENFVDVVKSHAPVNILRRVNAAKQFLTYSCALGIDKMTKLIEVGDRTIRLGAQPVGVNMQNIQRILDQSDTQSRIELLRKRTNGKHIILSVERLDYVKGPLEKIEAFGEFLDEHPEYHGQIELINICTPPSQGMKVYDRIQHELEQAVGRINGRYSTLEWTPIRFFFRSVPFEEVVSYYAVSDVAWITPLRDGLNLVAKEYIAVQGLQEKPFGALVISEFAGASVELPYAIRTNPYDSKDLKDSLLSALSLDATERSLRIKRMFEIVKHYDVRRWGQDFLEGLEKATQK